VYTDTASHRSLASSSKPIHRDIFLTCLVSFFCPLPLHTSPVKDTYQLSNPKNLSLKILLTARTNYFHLTLLVSPEQQVQTHTLISHWRQILTLYTAPASDQEFLLECSKTTRTKDYPVHLFLLALTFVEFNNYTCFLFVTVLFSIFIFFCFQNYLFFFLLAYINCTNGIYHDISIHEYSVLWSISPPLLSYPPSLSNFNSFRYSIFIHEYDIFQSHNPLHPLLLLSLLLQAPTPKHSPCSMLMSFFF
jgi:hypothetical protein